MLSTSLGSGPKTSPARDLGKTILRTPFGESEKVKSKLQSNVPLHYHNLHDSHLPCLERL